MKVDYKIGQKVWFYDINGNPVVGEIYSYNFGVTINSKNIDIFFNNYLAYVDGDKGGPSYSIQGYNSSETKEGLISKIKLSKIC